MKNNGERGNAIVEFLVFGLVAQLLIFGFLLKLGSDFRSQLAAEAIARQSLRVIQMGTDSGYGMAESVSAVFGIPVNEMKISIDNQCAQTGTIKINVSVRKNSYATKGFCLN
ncbi:MAG: hypothetical protein RLZZ471_254 [Actinomycetota bacterium]